MKGTNMSKTETSENEVSETETSENEVSENEVSENEVSETYLVYFENDEDPVFYASSLGDAKKFILTYGRDINKKYFIEEEQNNQFQLISLNKFSPTVYSRTELTGKIIKNNY